jgi:formyl-CoA transferase
VLDEGRVIFGVVQIAEEIIKDPQMHQNGVFLSLDHAGMPGGLTVGSPIQIAKHVKVAPSRAPALGEHSAEVLSELGFSAAEVQGMFAAGAASRPAPSGV